MVDWRSILVPSTPLLELLVRGSLTYLGLVVMARIVGRRKSGGLGVTDLLVVVLVSEAASNGVAGDYTSVPDGLIIVATILFWSVVLDALAYWSPWLATIIDGQPDTLITNGKINRRTARKELITDAEVLSQLRLHGIQALSEVRRAYLETNGQISVLRTDGNEPEQPNKHPATD